MSDGLTIPQRAVIEHNMAAAKKIYQSVDRCMKPMKHFSIRSPLRPAVGLPVFASTPSSLTPAIGGCIGCQKHSLRRAGEHSGDRCPPGRAHRSKDDLRGPAQRLHRPNRGRAALSGLHRSRGLVLVRCFATFRCAIRLPNQGLNERLYQEAVCWRGNKWTWQGPFDGKNRKSCSLSNTSSRRFLFMSLAPRCLPGTARGVG